MCKGKEIAQAYARLIDKFMIAKSRRDFYSVMDAAGPSCSDLAVTIFDKLGSVKTKWTTDLELKGSRIWDQALSHDNLLVIESNNVHMDYRRNMIGGKMVEAIVEEGINQKAEHVFVWVTQLNSAQDASEVDDPSSEEVFQANKARAIAFWRAMRFRRIGGSHWFGYAMDPADSSRRLAAEEDFDPVDGTIPVEDTEKLMLEYVGENAQLFRAVFGRF